jgi:rhodanese-related sulfurtransferase
MNLQPLATRTLFLFLCLVTIVNAGAGSRASLVSAQAQKSEDGIARITAEELKAKLSRNEPVTILDVRSTEGYVSNENRIKGSIHVKLRRLQFRLSFPPLKDIPRESEVVTYCACPNDESSIRAAQILLEAGFKNVRVLDGGWQMWQRVKGPVEPRPKA